MNMTSLIVNFDAIQSLLNSWKLRAEWERKIFWGGFFINIEQKKYTPLLVKLVYETDELIGTYLILT